MRKYFQISFFLGAFGILVFLRNASGGDSHFVASTTPNTGSQGSNTTTPTSTPAPQGNTNSTGQNSQSSNSTGQGYKDGTYTGSVADAFYGNIQVQVIISGGKITAVNFLQFPNDNPTSQYINSQADPLLSQEAIAAQSASVDIISGASASSQAFQQSLADALSQAK